MDPRKRGGGPGHHPGTPAHKISATAKQLDRADGDTRRVSAASAAQLVAFAKVLLGDPHAAQDQLVVERCPVEGCNYAHRHVVPAGTWRQPLVKAPRCKPWLRYRVEIVSVVPTTAAAAGLRKRGAA